MLRKPLAYPRHLTDEQLLRLADRELSQAEANRAQRHLDDCWTCRARAAQWQECVEGFIAWRERKASLADPPAAWAGFQGRLAAQARTLPAKAAPPFSRSLPFAYALAAALLVACVATVVLRPARLAPANELLERAQSREQAAVRSILRPVVHQRIRIQRGPATATAEYWREPDGRILRETWSDGSGPLPGQFRSLYERHRLDARNPLSPANHSRWRESLSTKDEQVTADDRRRLIRIRTTNRSAKAGEIHTATLSLRQTDLHPMEQAYRVRTESGDEEYKLAELAFEVLPAEQVMPTLFPALPAPAIRDTSTMSAAPAEPAAPSDGQLETAEALVRQALHDVEADRREVPDVVRNGTTIVVRALADTPERAQELTAALAGIPYTTPEVATAAPASQGVETLPAVEAAHVFTSTPPFAQALREYAGGLDPANNLLNEIRDALRPMRVEALALRRLARRYPDADRIRLAPQARQMVDQLFAGHTAAIRNGLTRLDPLLLPLLAKLAAHAGDGHPKSPALPERQDLVERLATSLTTLEETLGRMFDTNVLDRPPAYDGPALLREAIALHSTAAAIVRELAGAQPAKQVTTP